MSRARGKALTLFGQRLGDLRQKRGLTQIEAAAAAQVAQSRWAVWEIGRATPRADALPRIAAALGVTVADLAGTLFAEKAKG